MSADQLRAQQAALEAQLAAFNSYSNHEHVLAGGLMSYGASNPHAGRPAGIYTGRILKGEKPGELQVMRSTKFDFVINLKAAKALGLEFNPQMLSLADELVE